MSPNLLWWISIKCLCCIFCHQAQRKVYVPHGTAGFCFIQASTFLYFCATKCAQSFQCNPRGCKPVRTYSFWVRRALWVTFRTYTTNKWKYVLTRLETFSPHGHCLTKSIWTPRVLKWVSLACFRKNWFLTHNKVSSKRITKEGKVFWRS